MDKFTEVCGELARALEREEQLQGVLAIQKEQLEGQAKRLHAFNDNRVRQENVTASAGARVRTDIFQKLFHVDVYNYLIKCID